MVRHKRDRDETQNRADLRVWTSSQQKLPHFEREKAT